MGDRQRQTDRKMVSVKAAHAWAQPKKCTLGNLVLRKIEL